MVCDDPSLGPDDADSIEFYGGRVVCESVTKTNAILIVAAQDQNTALTKFDAAMENWYDGPEHPATPELLEAWALARAAIAKANQQRKPT